MHMAAGCICDDYDTWLSANAAVCHRLSARITMKTCREQQEKSSSALGDFRCRGCNGLFDQSPPPVLFSPDFARNACSESHDDPLPEPEVVEDTEGEDVDLSGLVPNISPEIAARIIEQDPELARELLALSADDDEPEHDEPGEVSPEASRPRRRMPDQPRRVAVYTGRCDRCGGYMVNTIERHDGIKDDEVYRCYTCGWRTSPGYEWNRRSDK